MHPATYSDIFQLLFSSFSAPFQFLFNFFSAPFLLLIFGFFLFFSCCFIEKRTIFIVFR